MDDIVHGTVIDDGIPHITDDQSHVPTFQQGAVDFFGLVSAAHHGQNGHSAVVNTVDGGQGTDGIGADQSSGAGDQDGLMGKGVPVQAAGGDVLQFLLTDWLLGVFDTSSHHDFLQLLLGDQ